MASRYAFFGRQIMLLVVVMQIKKRDEKSLYACYFVLLSVGYFWVFKEMFSFKNTIYRYIVKHIQTTKFSTKKLENSVNIE